MRLLALILLFSCTKESNDLTFEIEGARGRKPKVISTNATFSVLLDSDGEYVESSVWNGGLPFYAIPSSFDTSSAFKLARSKFNNFNVSLTTNQSEWLKATYRIKCIVTDSDFYPSVSGVAYTGTFKQGIEVFVFAHRNYNISERIGNVIAHEVGHSIGLYHQAKWSSDCVRLSSYMGCDLATMTGPIMGAANGCFTKWWVGATPYGCKDIQNDSLVLIDKLR